MAFVVPATLLVTLVLCVCDALPVQDTIDARNTRYYYLAAEKVVWDYLPSGHNLFSDDESVIKDTLVQGPDRIGNQYTKYIYKQYTNSSFTEEIPKAPSQGYVGPLIKAEVGEVVKVLFRNMADRPFSVHPHGVQYKKKHEGALYLDNTPPDHKVDDGVMPGTELELHWKINADFAPSDDDPNCVPYAYHSHIDPDREVNSGLLGLLVVCKQGTLTADGRRQDVDRELVLYFDAIDEGQSWLIEENLKRCRNPAECKRLFDEGDADFMESISRDSINGYQFGNLPNLEVCEGEKVAWYLFSLNFELHPVTILGQSFMYEHHRTSAIGLWSATFKTATMVPANPGVWTVACYNAEHQRNGMVGMMSVMKCANKTVHPEQLSGNVRRYFFSAETEVWDYAPSGQNKYDGGLLTEPGSESSFYFNTTYDNANRIGGKYKKTRYYEYTDTFFKTKVPRTEEDSHLGLLGPVIRAEVGDTIEVTLLNKAPFPVAVYLQGTSLDKSQDGVWMKTSATANAMHGHDVPTNNVGTYTFTVPWSRSPTGDDPQCVPYLYYSTYRSDKSIYSGLVGPLLICKPGALDPTTGRQHFVDRDLFLFFASIDENQSWLVDDNIATYVPGHVDKTNADFMESNIMFSINGRSYGNLEGLNVCKGERVAWHVLSFGETAGLHSATFNGNNVMVAGINRDSHVIISGMAFTAMMHPSNVGNWSVHCHNNFQFERGMKAVYTVDSCGKTSAAYVEKSGVTRRYYIGAVERKWNYSPKTIHPLTGENYSDPNSDMYFRVQRDGKYIGSVYTKALYREFTDATFTTEKPIGDADKHRGILGPFIRAAVGDVIEVVFKNMASRPYSIHAQGVRYDKANEGMKYEGDGTDNTGDAVSPGTTFTYHWEVPQSSGPGPNGPNCVASIYYSATNPVKDEYSGLVGPLVLCRPGILDKNGTRQDSVDKELAVLFQAFDENESWYLEKNIQEYAPSANTTTDDFIESNKYDSINGLIYGNAEGLVANFGENIAWYVLAMGENEDYHTAHFHGQTYRYRTQGTHVGDVIEVFPGTYETVEMFAENRGTWLLHCHVSQHVTDGMITTYTIL